MSGAHKGDTGPDVGRDARVAQRLVALADTLVDDFDVVDLMDRLVGTCVELLGTDTAGLLLADQRGKLQLVASSSEETRRLELFQLQSEEGPCLDCFHTGLPVREPDLAAASTRWPRFTQAAAAFGYVSVYAVPLRLRDQAVGALNLFRSGRPALSADDQRVAQALADVATIGLLQQRTRQRATALAEQLQGALDSRVVIEQAKGVLAEHGRVDMSTAYAALRRFSRNHNQKIAEVAERVVGRTTSLDAVLETSPSETGSV
ncbi:GAF and ANTAR domain-containing protein [Nocardioides sp. WL0053]|uniref:GAF and ANTAR domain-containing protein n=1 Tax=Nocardioides jiangsuensis TaxID=2866161 RepID=A0ABS7RP52_9ACTN|nr:GAF and ANTAR domain-containing protein [Nocardioides jiangsuensis]MBY9076526.1 GAF and ANTAR domain-containing protein [Nocardioides jiangsuensis]